LLDVLAGVVSSLPGLPERPVERTAVVLLHGRTPN
jgi:hypothetical protein